MTNRARVLKAILRSDFHAFAKRAFRELHNGTAIKRNWHHRAIAHRLTSMSKPGRLIINMPPRSLKSFICSVAWPAFLLGNDPSKKVICVSYSQELGEDLAQKFRRLIESDWMRELFPELEISRSTAAEVTTTSGGFRFTTSPDGTLTGRGGDVIIIDDPLSASDAYSDSRRDYINRWFSSTLMSRLDDPSSGAIVLVMQRLHENDLAGFLLRTEKWDSLILPAIAPKTEEFDLGNERYVFQKDEYLEPARSDPGTLHELKSAMGSAAFDSQYLQKPSPETGRDLNIGWLKRFDLIAPIDETAQVVQSWDTALKAGADNDYSVCLTFKIVNSNAYYLIDVYRERLETPELVREIHCQAKKHRASAVLIEEAVSGIAVVQLAKCEGVQGVVGIKHRGDKRTRMKSASPKVEGGSLHVPIAAPWLDEFVKEYAAFPAGRHDDQVDALSQFLNWRTNQEDGGFEADFGSYDEGAPDAEEILHHLYGASRY